MKPFKVEVQTWGSGGEWAGNAMKYASVTEAAVAARDLFYRWTSVREWRVTDESGEVFATSLPTELAKRYLTQLDCIDDTSYKTLRAMYAKFGVHAADAAIEAELKKWRTK
jgi:hypothetical protein